MAKTVVTVGFDISSDQTKYEEFGSKASLLDWDIVLFRPDISAFTTYDDTYQGKPSLNDFSSFRLKEQCEHWRREIKQAVESGKTVIVFLSALQEVFIDTGQRQYSGTGRSQRTTRIVAPYNNYKCIPSDLELVGATGKAMKLTTTGGEMLGPYWAEFGSKSNFRILLPPDMKSVCLTTRHGEKPVGAIIRNSNSGSLVLLPDIDFYQKGFTTEKDGETFWTAEAGKFAAKLLSAVIALDSALRSTTEVTPEPAWAMKQAYALAKEVDLRSQLLMAERKVEEAQKKKEKLIEKLKEAGKLRGLLYEKGKPLEYAILDALRIIGFKASQYKEANSEFDVVFESDEGRLLGEAEGKDGKAINVDKLRQLAMNIHEDLRRDNVVVPAKGVLFGNGFRLIVPDKREVQFTDKCILAAKLSSTALVATPDLYRAVQYLSRTSDADYSALCRKAMIEGIGLIALPTPPSCEPDEDTSA